MIHFVFDLDDTLIIHEKNISIDYYKMKEDLLLTECLKKCKGKCYIYTNGTGGHALEVIKRMNIINMFEKIYSRDTIPSMKPYINSFISVDRDIGNLYPGSKVVFFFDDLLENLKTAHQLGWKTFWINPNHKEGYKYSFVDLSFPNIKDCLIYLESKF